MEYEEDEMVEESLIDETVPVSSNGSLSSRMEQRAEVLQRQTSERFPIPGFDGIVDVELRALGHKVESAINHRHERLRDPALRELYTMCDTLLAATVGLHEITDTGEARSIDDDWIRLAQRLQGCPEVPTPRQALLFVVTDQRVKYLFVEWQQWARRTNSDIDEEVAQDFATTG